MSNWGITVESWRWSEIVEDNETISREKDSDLQLRLMSVHQMNL